MLFNHVCGQRENVSGRLINDENQGLTLSSPSYLAVKKALCTLFRLDDFHHELIGSGFFSEVYKVTHIVTNQELVLKVNTQLSNRINVLREIQLLSKVSHPNVIRLLGVCVSEGQLHVLTEFINNGTLEQLVADKSVELTWSVRIRLACDVAKGLKYLHCRGFMHRDLTSKNILIKKQMDGRMMAVVADLGLAISIPDPVLNKCLPIVGSPYWMAPECIMGYKYNEKADIFSYGIVMCELIARVSADPEVLPRTNKFGVDYVAFSKMAADCPLHFLHLTFICCQIDSSKRPSSYELVNSLEMLKYSALMAVILADLGCSHSDHAINRAILEDILDVKRHKRTYSDVRNVTLTRRVVPVTTLTVGLVMSEDDVHYVPHANVNPFSACFLDSAVKIVDGLQLYVNDQTRAQVQPRRLTVSRCLSLPNSPAMSHDGSTTFHVTSDNSETISSVDSALELDVLSDKCVIAKRAEDLEVLFDDDDMSCSITDDSSSVMSSTHDDVSTLLSPKRTTLPDASYCELNSSVWHERFQRLLNHWQTRQLDVGVSGLPPRLRLAVPYLVQRFAELRRVWEEHQQSVSESVNK